VTIDNLPDNVLLDIFDYCLEGRYIDIWTQEWAWRTLILVCRRWRSIILASPHRLDLRIICTDRTRAKEISGIWPTLPIEIVAGGWARHNPWRRRDANNVIAALKHNNRICRISLLETSSSLLEQITEITTTTQAAPFPALTHLRLTRCDSPYNEREGALPDEFLGGSTPRLRSCFLRHIAFPGIWNLLLTADHLVELRLSNIPHSDYISPQAMATHLSMMPNLKRLSIGFQSPRSRPDLSSPQKFRSPPARVVFPALTSFWFRGVSEYADDLTSHIHAPLLGEINITLFNQLIFNTPRLHDFFSRHWHNKLPRGPATVKFECGSVTFQHKSMGLSLEVSCAKSDWQLFDSPLPPFADLEHLHLQICEDPYNEGPRWQDDTESSQWLELVQPFHSVKNLYLSREIAPRAALALQGLTGQSVTEILPALKYLFVEWFQLLPLEEDVIGKFVNARQLSGHPVAVHRWDGRL
jgi:hypothetical protein